MDSKPIVGAVQAGKLTAVRVTTAFCKTAAIAHQIVSSSSRTPPTVK
jgi:amidase